ncbi:MAG: peptidoglycan DD-metalloendopeptidase family protein [Syntrophomonadaceae bacterium]|nr:peptidoglycan DD-metalloendopeptidase family protein [Syntrophomonadaceae bacterium]
MTKIHKKALLLLLVIFIGSLVLPVYANPDDEIDELQRQMELDQQRQQLERINEEMQQQQARIDAAKKEEKNVLGSIRRLENDISATRAEISSLDGSIDSLTVNIEEAQVEIDRLEEEIALSSELCAEHLVFMYKQGSVSYIEVLLAAEDFSDFLSRFDMLGYIIEQDQQVIENLAQQQMVMEQKRSELESNKENLQNARSDKQIKQSSLSEQVNDQETLLGSIEEEREKLEQAFNELEESSKAVEQLIRSLQSAGGNVMGTGVFTWPCPGNYTITSDYGMRYHPILGYNKMHTGTDIAASSGTPIVAADDGQVISSSYLNGYGETIIIDHGNGISTLYAHQSSRLTAVGDVVAKGQTIGLVGSTGWSTGPHLHFEVRVNGNYVNPWDYISK